MKQCNPRYGCPRIAQQVNLAFGLDIDKNVVRRILAVHYKPEPGNSGQDWPERISSDNDPLFQYDQWKANLRVLDIEEIKSVPYVPMSHS